jgi:hypothetical protein
MNLVDIRPKLAAALAPVAATDPSVYPGFVDSIQPPALMLLPVSGRGDRTPCIFAVAGVVLMLAARFEPGAGMDTLDQLTSYTLTRMAGLPDLGVESWSEARGFVVGGITYLGSRLVYTTLAEN